MNKLFITGTIASVSAMPVYRMAQDTPRVTDRIWDKDLSYQRENKIEDKNPETSWGMGNGQGSEKQDAIWHAANNAATPEKFDEAMAKNAGKMTAGNSAEVEPSTRYFTGAYAQRDMGQMADSTQFKWWADGKGAGSEKQDAFWDIAHQAADSAQFDKDAAYFPGISAGNAEDGAPGNKYFSSQQMGFAQVQGPPAPEGQYAWRKSVYPVRGMGQPFPNIDSTEGAGAPIFKQWTNGNGLGSEKEDFAKDIERNSNGDTLKFHKDTAYFPGVGSANGHDSTPEDHYFGEQRAAGNLAQVYGPPAPEGQYAWRKSVYPVRGMGQPFPNIGSTEGAGAPIFKQWTNGNGLGSEKEDFAKDIERNSNGDTGKFHKDTAYFPGVGSANGHDSTPEDHYFGEQRAAGNLAQVYGPPAPEGQYGWRQSVYPVRGQGQPFPNIGSTEGAGAPIFKQWTNGNGLGSEKEDFAKDIERNSAGDTGKFHKDTAYFPGVGSANGNDEAPQGKYYGGPEFMGN